MQLLQLLLVLLLLLFQSSALRADPFDRFTNPILATYGDVEEAVNVPVEIATALIEEMATASPRVATAVIHGANHVYWGHEEELVAAIRELAALDASHGVTQHFYIYTPLKTPLHPKDHEIIDETTRLLDNWAATEERVSILNANPNLRQRPIDSREIP